MVTNEHDANHSVLQRASCHAPGELWTADPDLQPFSGCCRLPSAIGIVSRSMPAPPSAWLGIPCRSRPDPFGGRTRRPALIARFYACRRGERASPPNPAPDIGSVPLGVDRSRMEGPLFTAFVDVLFVRASFSSERERKQKLVPEGCANTYEVDRVA